MGRAVAPARCTVPAPVRFLRWDRTGAGKGRQAMMRYGILAVLLVAVGFGCIKLGERGSRAVERLLADRVENGLAVLGIDWAEVRADGLRIELHGHAPDILARDLALDTARATASIAVVAKLVA